MYTDKDGVEIQPGMILKHDSGGLYRVIIENGKMCLESELSGFIFDMQYLFATNQCMNLTIQEDQNG